jgi:glutathione S-transferase
MRISETDYLEESGKELYPFIFGQKKVEEHPEVLTAALEKLRKEFTFWNSVIKPGGFVLGDQLTAADIVLYPFVAWWTRYDATFQDFPTYEMITWYLTYLTSLD